jgi:branched-chain amino acid transport system ATP-binding protein
MSPTSSEPALRLHAISKSFGGLRAVDAVELTVQPGERRALIGPNGAGKTTLFNLIAGALPVSGGRITLFGADVTGMAQHRRAALGLARTFQITNLFPTLSVLDNVRLAAQARSATRFAMLRPVRGFADLEMRARQALDAVGLADQADRRVRQLSHGEQRQLEIALALAGRPRVLLLDEPAAGLSQAEAQHMTALLRGLDPAITLLIIEHDMDIALEVARHVTVLHYGKVIADGSREAVRADPTVREIYLGA